jgi:acyl-CoA dehydrogenase
MACGVVDRAMQAYGAEGLSQDQELASMYAQLRTLRLADVRLLFLHRRVVVDAFFTGT